VNNYIENPVNISLGLFYTLFAIFINIYLSW